MKKENKSFMEKNKKQVIAIALALVLLIGGSYAWLSVTLKGTKKVRIEAGTLSLVLNEGNEINVSDSVPMSDVDGLKTDAYTFSLENNGNVTSEYTIYLDDASIDSADERFDDSALKYSLKKNDGASTTALLSTLQDSNGKRVLETGTIEAGTTNTYSLNLWIKDEATNDDVQTTKDGQTVGKVFAGKLRIEASQIKE